ncbi:MAG: hypothetical protein WC858_02930 [Parcubacteria group bacterium]|jgi:4-amino-4-deoxy-L-arabinose transferase-like glycosyltransferase
MKRKKTVSRKKTAIVSDVEPKSNFSRHHKYIFIGLVVVLLLIAFGIRTYHLTSLPPGIYPDEAVNGTDAIRANETGHYQLFYSNNYGREGLFMNLIALGFLFFGVSIVTLKMWSIFFGTLTVLGMVLLGRELFKSWRAGLIAGFLIATSFWAINFSRIAFRANMLPFVLVFSFYFLFRGLRIYSARISQNQRDTTKNLDFFSKIKNWCGANYNYILAGALFGLGVHTYIAFRIAPVILIAIFFAFLLSGKNFLRTHWKTILIFTLSIIVVALPMLLTFYYHPEYFETRSEAVSVLSPKVNQGHPLKALATSIALNLKMFNFHGDQNWRHNLPSQPELQLLVGVFFLLGIGYYLAQFFRLLYLRIRREKRSEEFVISTFLLSWFFAMLLPGILAYEGLPHSLRVIGAMPVALLFATFAFESVFKFFDKIQNRYWRTLTYVILTVAIISSGVISVRRYFVDWGNSLNIHAAFSQNLKNMALFLNNLPPKYNKYVVANAGGQIMNDGMPVAAHVVELLTHYRTPGIVFLRPDFDPKIIKPRAKIALMYYNGEVIAKIKSIYPDAQVQKLDPQPGNGTDYFVVNIN